MNIINQWETEDERLIANYTILKEYPKNYKLGVTNEEFQKYVSKLTTFCYQYLKKIDRIEKTNVSDTFLKEDKNIQLETAKWKYLAYLSLEVRKYNSGKMEYTKPVIYINNKVLKASIEMNDFIALYETMKHELMHYYLYTLSSKENKKDWDDGGIKFESMLKKYNLESSIKTADSKVLGRKKDSMLTNVTVLTCPSCGTRNIYNTQTTNHSKRKLKCTVCKNVNKYIETKATLKTEIKYK